VTLSEDRVMNGKLMLFTSKTGTVVFCRFLHSSWQNWKPCRAQTGNIFSGAEKESESRVLEIGSGASRNYFAWLACRVATAFVSATHGLPNLS